MGRDFLKTNLRIGDTLKKSDQVHNLHKQKNVPTQQPTKPGETTNLQVPKSLVLESKVWKCLLLGMLAGITAWTTLFCLLPIPVSALSSK